MGSGRSDAIGDHVVYCGASGAGSATKLVNNMISLSLNVLLGEALALGVRAGVELETLVETFWEQFAPGIECAGVEVIPTNKLTLADIDKYQRFDLRVSKAFQLGAPRLEVIGQIFNLFGTVNLGGIGVGRQTNALSNAFGRILGAQTRQQGEVALRVTW